jgi:hypothetical protein
MISVPCEVLEALLLNAGTAAADGVEVEVSVVAVFDCALSLAGIKVESEAFSDNSWCALASASIAVPDSWLSGIFSKERAVIWLALDGSSLEIEELIGWVAWGSWRELA